MSRSSSQRGFTLVELLVVVALVVILIGLAAPSFKRTIEAQRVRSINADLVTDLQFARSEAASRNARMRINFRVNSDMTCYSIFTYTNDGIKCDCRLASPCTGVGLTEVRTVRIPVSTGVSVRPVSGQPIEFAFEPLTGSLFTIPIDEAYTPLSQYVVRTFIDSERQLNTTVGQSGRPTVCAPSGSTMQATAC